MKLVVLSHTQKLQDLGSTDVVYALQNEVRGAIVETFLMARDTGRGFVAEKENEGLAVVPEVSAVLRHT